MHITSSLIPLLITFFLLGAWAGTSVHYILMPSLWLLTCVWDRKQESLPSPHPSPPTSYFLPLAYSRTLAFFLACGVLLHTCFSCLPWDRPLPCPLFCLLPSFLYCPCLALLPSFVIYCPYTHTFCPFPHTPVPAFLPSPYTILCIHLFCACAF